MTHRRTRFVGLHTLLESRRGAEVALPPTLKRLYGRLRLEKPGSRPRVLSNFVSTLDGVVSLKTRGHEGGGDISGFSAEDRMVMGLLRAVSDVVILGGGSLAADPGRLWTAAAICPELAAEYRRLRSSLGKDSHPLKVVVSASGNLKLRSPVFTGSDGPLVIVTSRAGAERLSGGKLPAGIDICVLPGGGKTLSAQAILKAVCGSASPQRVLVEGGPRLLASFYAERLIDEQFLTLAPQLAGRGLEDGRLSLVMGRLFAPRDPRWATLSDVRRCANHLFLRYCFEPEPGAAVRRRPRVG